MKTTTLTNSFHGTTVKISDTWGDTPGEAWEALQHSAFQELHYGKARRTLRRVEKALCGMADCACGTFRP